MKQQLTNMINEIHAIPQKTRMDLWKDCITARLDESYNVYQHELDNSLQYLKQRNETTVLKKLNRMKINEQADK